MEITLSRVVEAARQRRAAVTAEAGGYIVLLVVQRLATGPCQVTAEQILLTANGEIAIGASPPAEPLEAERGLRRLLGSLLSLAQSAPPALKGASERVPAGGLAALEAELMAALIPINHAASGRALARLFRETQRATRGAGTEPSDSEPGSLLPSSRTSSAPETPRPPLPMSAPPSLVAPAPPRVAASTPPAAAQAAPLSAASVEAQPELEIDVEIVLAESSEGSAEVAVRFEEIDVAVAELDVAAEDLDALLAEEASPTALLVAPAELLAETSPLPPLAAPAELLAEAASPTAPPAAASEVCEPSPSPSLPSEGDPYADTPPLDSSPLLADTAWDPEPPPQRSDLRELLNGYLAHTRCEEHMTADLRRRIGLEPWRAVGSEDARN